MEWTSSPRFLITLDYPIANCCSLHCLHGRKTQLPSTHTGNRYDPGGGDDSVNAAEIRTHKHSGLAPLGPRDRYVAPEMKDWTAIYRIGHNLLIPASINSSKQTMFILDTGAFSTTISPDVAREVTKVHANDNIRVHGISGEVDKVYTADSITFQFANVSQKVQDVVAFATPSLSKSLSMEISGFIGYTALNQMTINIDYRDGLMKFSYDPNRRLQTLRNSGYHLCCKRSDLASRAHPPQPSRRMGFL